MGIDVNDMEYVFRETEYVTGVHQVHGGSGDPSPFTAYGTLQGLTRTDKPAFCFQGHPEASPGPHDIAYLFDRFIHLMEKK